MGVRSLTMKVPCGVATGCGEMGNTEVIGKVPPVAVARTIPEVASCDCQNCRNVADASHSLHISPLASIDVFSLPDETVRIGTRA